jgi:SAM-dependent methyltransferase
MQHSPVVRTDAGRTGALDGYLRAIQAEGLWRSRAALRRYCAWLFRDVPLAGSRVLDVGGGAGVFSFYAAAAGAREVVCLEPEGEGGSVGMNAQFDRLRQATDLHNVRLVHVTFQKFVPPAGRFDIVLVHNSINHLDEGAVVSLHRPASSDGAEAREVYRLIFTQLADALDPGGHLVLADCARTNLFPLLGLRHPLLPQIEWHKHQDPAVWSELLRGAGFDRRSLRWSSFNNLGRPGWLLLANRVGAFVFSGHFRLHARKVDGRGAAR